jgi:hypothetical protein
MDELTIGDKVYISSKRAAAITGYAKDYVGQLCREGHVEAKMVGRSWYVLASSIRAHRFGQSESNGTIESKAPESTVSAAPQEPPRSALPPTWEAPKYVAEEPAFMPVLAQEITVIETYESPQSLDMSDERESLSEMQSAWKEWFETKKEPEIVNEQEYKEDKEVPETIDEEVPVVVHKIEPTREIPVAHIPASEPIKVYVPPAAPQEHGRFTSRAKQKAHRRQRHSSNLVTTALLVAVAGIVVAVAYIGSGFGNPYVGTNPIFEYLGGTSSIQK